MIEMPCWACTGRGHLCTQCQGTGKLRTTRMDAWARRKLYFGTPRTKEERQRADRHGNEKFQRYTAEVPPEFDFELREAYKAVMGQYPKTGADITRVALFHLLQTKRPEETAIETDAADIIVRQELTA